MSGSSSKTQKELKDWREKIEDKLTPYLKLKKNWKHQYMNNISPLSHHPKTQKELKGTWDPSFPSSYSSSLKLKKNWKIFRSNSLRTRFDIPSKTQKELKEEPRAKDNISRTSRI